MTPAHKAENCGASFIKQRLQALRAKYKH